MKKETVTERQLLLRKVLEIIKKKNITAYQIRKGTGMSTAGIQKIIDGVTKNPTLNTLKAILSVIDPEEPINQSEAKPVYNEIVEVPIVQTKARAGYALSYADPEYVNSLPKVFIPKQYEKGNFMVFEIEGDSMDDGSYRSILHGDCYLCKELEPLYWTQKLFYKKYLFLIVYNNSVVCKQITNHDVEKGTIKCHSFNPIYEDFEVDLRDVNQIFYLVKLVEREINF